MTEPKNIDEAILLLQADLPVLTKDKDGQVGNQKTKYADLAQANEQVLTRLNALGVIWVCKPTLLLPDYRFVLDWELKHVASDTSKSGLYPVKGETPMQQGSAITYGRRYALLAVTGVVAEDEDDDGRAAVGHHTAQRATHGRQPAGQATAQRAPRPRSATDAPPLPGESAGITEPQRKHIFALLGERGITDRDQRLAGISKVVGRQIASTNELTSAEAVTVINSLNPDPEPAGTEPT